MVTAREVRLVRNPKGAPVAEDFAVVETNLGAPAPGEVALQTLILSVDPYQRLQMDDPAALNRVMAGSGVARVTASRNANFREGELVRHRGGMRDLLLSDGANLMKFDVDADLPLAVQMNALGGIGLCAYGGLLETGRLREGEQVFVSAAAGAVGSLAVQIARLRGCCVVGSAGSRDKADWIVNDLGANAAINYREQDIAEALAAVTPNGVDVYFDNVGGAHLDAALLRMNKNGRIAVCGMISAYNADSAPVKLLHKMTWPRVTIKGFGFDEFAHMQSAFRNDMLGWLKSGQIRTRETIFDGIARVPEALIGLFEGRNCGKMLVRISD
jgi:NADPH-dependent curcumin reductase CurA